MRIIIIHLHVEVRMGERADVLMAQEQMVRERGGGE